MYPNYLDKALQFYSIFQPYPNLFRFSTIPFLIWLLNIIFCCGPQLISCWLVFFLHCNISSDLTRVMCLKIHFPLSEVTLHDVIYNYLIQFFRSCESIPGVFPQEVHVLITPRDQLDSWIIFIWNLFSRFPWHLLTSYERT